MSLRPTLQPLLATTSRLASTSAVRASTSAPPPPPPPTSNSDRVYTERKTYLYNYYAHLLKTSQVVLMFQHDNLTVANLAKIRRGIAKIPPPLAPTTPSSSKTNELTTSTTPPQSQGATFTILRTGLLSALTRHQSIPFPPLKGQTALISSPTLSPRYIQQILTSITRSIKQSQKEVPSGKEASIKQPALTLTFGFLENGKLLNVKEIEAVGKLSELDGLRSELVGLLEMRGRELVGVLGQAGGGGLVRTLQGLENDLKEKEGGAGA